MQLLSQFNYVFVTIPCLADKRGKKEKQKVGQKQKQKKKNESDAESDVSSEEDGYMDSKEMDYLSDSSSSSEGMSSVNAAKKCSVAFT